MKLKEKLKPRSLSTSGRSGSKKSSDFSEIHFVGDTRGRKTSDNEFEDDGGFGQFQQLQQNFSNRRQRGSDHSHVHKSGTHDETGDCEVCGVPMATLTRRVRSVVEKAGTAAGKHSKDHSNCSKCNKAQPDTFQTVAIPHEHPEQRGPSEDLWDGNHGRAMRPRYASESNLLRAPLKPMPFGYSPSVQNVYLPNGNNSGGPGSETPSGMRRNMPPGNTCYVQWGTEVKKITLPLAPAYNDENIGGGLDGFGGVVALNSMRELHALLVSTFPIAVTDEDLSSKRKVVYIKDENTGIFYELEDIGDVKPRCFLSIRDYSAATLPNSKSGPLYDKADGSSRNMNPMSPPSDSPLMAATLGGRPSSRTPMKLSVFQPVTPANGRADVRNNPPLLHPKATGGSQPAGLDQIDRERSASFNREIQKTTSGRSGMGSGAQTLGRNFSGTNTRNIISTTSSTQRSTGYSSDMQSPDFQVTALEENDVFARTPPSTGKQLAPATDTMDFSESSGKHFENSTYRELIDKSSTYVIREGVKDDANSQKLDHIEGQLGDLTSLVNALLAKQSAEIAAKKDSQNSDEQAAAIQAELAALEKVKSMFESQMVTNNSSSTTTHTNVQQFISSVNERNRITFEQLCALRERTRHLRLELNQLKRSHANHVTAGQLMIREASQRITSAIEAFSHHSRREEEARSKRTSALAQAWALHLATLDKLESEIGEMELMVEKIRSDAEQYMKYGSTGSSMAVSGDPTNFRAIWDRRIEQLTQSVSDTGVLISKVKVDLLEFETQMSDLMRLGGAVGDGQKRLLKDGPDRLSMFIERIRLLNNHLAELKALEVEAYQNRQLFEELQSNRPQSTPPEVPLHLTIGSSSDIDRMSLLGDSRTSSLRRSTRGKSPVSVSATTSSTNRYESNNSTTNVLNSTTLENYNSLNKSRSFGSLSNSNLNPVTPNTPGSANVNKNYSHFEQHFYSSTNTKDGQGTTKTSMSTSASGTQPDKERLQQLVTDLDSSQTSASLSYLSQNKKRTANQIKRKSSESSRDRERESLASSILDTAYAKDRDSLEVIRKTSGATTRFINRETVIDDYYSTVHQLQKSNREHLSSSRSQLDSQDSASQRCRTDLLVKDVDARFKSRESLAQSGQASPTSTTGGEKDKSKQVTTYTYYTITKDGQKKTIYGGKQQKVVPPGEQSND